MSGTFEIQVPLAVTNNVGKNKFIIRKSDIYYSRTTLLRRSPSGSCYLLLPLQAIHYKRASNVKCSRDDTPINSYHLHRRSPPLLFRFSVCLPQSLIAVHKYTPALAASATLSANSSALEVFRCKIQTLSIETTWLHPHGRDPSRFGFAQNL